MESLIGKRVMNRRTKTTGIIKDIKDGIVYVSDGFDIWKYSYPAAFADTLVLEDEEIQDQLRFQSFDAKFEKFRKLYAAAIYKEISYLKTTGGKKYRVVDGERISITKNESYIYAFDTDSELHFPDGTVIKLWLKEEIVYANVISCEEFTIIFQTAVDLGEKVETLEFTAEPWQLIESLIERLYELNEEDSPIAYQLACTGMSQIDYRRSIILG